MSGCSGCDHLRELLTAARADADQWKLAVTAMLVKVGASAEEILDVIG